MKTIVSVLLGFCLVLTCAGCGPSGTAISYDNSTSFVEEQAEESETNIQNDEREVMVWIPHTGKRYHRNPRCSGMKNPNNVSVSEAESRGYTPCKNCY